jgi:hypothetical protein
MSGEAPSDDAGIARYFGWRNQTVEKWEDKHGAVSQHSCLALSPMEIGRQLSFGLSGPRGR